MMDKDPLKDLNDKLVYMVSCVVVFIIILMLAGVLHSCGTGPSKKTVYVDEPSGEACVKEETPTRILECTEGSEGSIIQVCSDNIWIEASNTCKAVNNKCANQISWEAKIKEIVVTNCAECHGTYRDYENVKNLGLASVGGVSGVSKLLYYISLPESDAKHMPKNRPNLKPADIQAIEDWAKADYPLGQDCADKRAVYDIEYLESEALRLASQITDADDRLNYRFISFAGKANLGESVENEYKAINRGMNSISFENNIYLCKPVDKDGVLCAMDIREFGLSLAKFNNIENNLDVEWESETTKGKLLQDLLGTFNPIIPSDLFLDTVFNDTRVYYNVMGFENRDQALALFGVDLAADIANAELKQIGINDSKITAARNTRLITIHEGRVNGFDRSVYISFDNPATAGAQFDLLQSPFLDPAKSEKIFNFAASETIAHLPNGLQAYFLNDLNGVLADFAPETIVFCNAGPGLCIDGTINNPIDCLGCHHDGLLQATDVVRDHVLNSGTFNAVEVELTKQVYNTANVNSATLNADNFVYEKGLKDVGINLGEANHLVNTVYTYNRSQSLEQVAAFLLVTPKALEECIKGSGILEAQIGVLTRGGKITHDTFEQAFELILDECGILRDPILPE